MTGSKEQIKDRLRTLAHMVRNARMVTPSAGASEATHRAVVTSYEKAFSVMTGTVPGSSAFENKLSYFNNPLLTVDGRDTD